ncbi:DUF1275 domain-containing protein [Ilyomonas limi]|uniref:DUF1275 domain-containing protein n=1 Tax=Ilyomonas limi TaxID=2575867 RepID=A0A4V5UU15_9BACT|nr:YoaK family protein [Ilyomonas limi]TKK65583.1 DUF1275 domain-containing protein [Ilyomonas limi]
MFRHKGKSRTYIHNLKLASMLSLVAGMVNTTGILSVHTLTTNLTGHFAYFAEDFSVKNYGMALTYLSFVLSFLTGAFVSNLLTEITVRIKPAIGHVLPMFIEISILITIGLTGDPFLSSAVDSRLMACSLLFAMGVQNALVTSVSQSVVRTTHLTGTFTDLGIELSQLFFYRKTNSIHQLTRSIYLKLAIISCFFFGGISAGLMYSTFRLKTLLFASAFLLIAFYYDNMRFRYYRIKRKIQSK